MIMRYYLTHDLDYARRRAYPYIVEVMNFWEDYLVVENGRYVARNDCVNECCFFVLLPEDSPEFERAKDKNFPLSLGLIRMMARAAIDMSEALGLDDLRRAKWRHILDQISAFPMTERGGKTMFYVCERGVTTLEEVNMCCIQHIYPANTVSLSSDPVLVQAAVDTILYKDLWEKLDQAGADAWALLEWVMSLPVAVQAQPKVTLLAQVFDEYFARVEQAWHGRRQHAVGGVVNPHEPEAQWRTKGPKKSWTGYQVQVAETAAEQPVAGGEPTRQFVTAVETQVATASDEAGLEQVLAVQQATGHERPRELYVDGAYVSAGKMVAARAEGWELLGPAQPSASKGTGYSAEEFVVDVAARTATCPAGQASTQCSRLAEVASGKVSYRFEWSWRCRDCARRGDCVGQNQAQRSLVVGEHHAALQARRAEMKTDAFTGLMKRRAAIEGTISELVRAHGLRRARYRGLKKVALQNWLTGAACNVERWLRLLAWELDAVPS
jgi:hypothetical protein